MNGDVANSRRPRRYIWVSTASIVTVSLLALLLQGQREKRSIQLRDGTMLCLRSITYGLRHDPQVSPKWQVKLDELLPVRWQGKFAPHRMNHNSTEKDPTLQLWFTVESGTSPKYHLVPQTLWFEFETDIGCAPGGMRGGMGSRRDGFETVGYSFHFFPRRSPRIKFKAYDSETLLGEFEINQPATGPFPTWTARALPQSVTNRDVEFRLSGFTSSVGGNSRSFGPQFHPEISAVRNGASADDWYLTELIFKDPTGNTSYCGLREDEPVWRLSTTWMRKGTASYGTNDMLSFHNLAFPKPGEIIELARTSTVGDAHFQSIFICGRGDYIWTNNAMAPASAPLPQQYVKPSGDILSSMVGLARPGVVACLDAYPQNGALWVRTMDDQKRWMHVGVVGGENLRTIELELDPDAQSFRLEIIPQKPFVAEFDFAKPQFPDPVPASLREEIKKTAAN